MDDQNTIKANQSHMNVLLISKVDNIQNPCLSLKSGFFLYFIGFFWKILLEFYSHGQTWYQKFIGTYLPLRSPAPVRNFFVKQNEYGLGQSESDNVFISAVKAKDLMITGSSILLFLIQLLFQWKNKNMEFSAIP